MTEAAKEAEKVLGINEKQRDAAVFLANLYHELGDGNRATELVSLINGLDNTSPSAYGEMASLYSKIEGDLEQAILVVSNGLKAYPDDPHLLAQLTSLRVAAGDTESALALSEEELGKLSASPEVLASLLSTAVEAKQFAEAYRIARELHKHDVNNRSACLFALVDEVREDFQHQTFDNPAKFTERMSRIDLTGLSSVEHRHYQFLSGLTNLRGNQSISESLSKVKRVLSVDSEIYSIWKDVLDRTFSSIAGSTESPAEMHMLLDHFTPLSKQLKSDELMTLAADTSRRLGEHYENNGDWANAERLFALSLQLNENEQVQKALDRVSLRSRKKTLKIAGIATAVVVVAVGAGLLYYFGQGQIEITSTPAATIKVLKGEKVVFEAQPSEGDSVSHVVTPFLLFGDYTVQAERPGYSSDPNQIAVGFGRSTTSCSASMNPQYGGLRLDSYPKGAEVYLDDDFVGKAPIALDSLLAKPTRISVRHNEYNAFIKDIGIVSDTAIDLGTIKFESFLSVDSRPSGANVYVSERLIGKTPIRDASVEAKTSNVRIEVTGQAVFGDSSVFFSPGVTVDLGAILLKPAGSIQVSSSPSACAVYVDGKFRGNTPTSIQTMGTGRHQIEGRRPFFEPAIASVSVKEGKTQDVQLRLKQFDGDWIVNAYMQPQFFGKADPREGKGRSTRLFFLRIEDIGNGHLDAYLCDSLFFLHSSAWTRIHQEATLTRRLLYDYSFYSILPWSDKCALSKSDDNIAIQINEAKADNGIWDIELNMCKDGRHMLGYLKVKRQGYLVGSTVSFTLHLFAERVK
jgi:tetratricopeptide (TPR) repeat protein